MKLPPNIHLFEVTADLRGPPQDDMVWYVLLRPLRPELRSAVTSNAINVCQIDDIFFACMVRSSSKK
jgi:hypothetical protein